MYHLIQLKIDEINMNSVFFFFWYKRCIESVSFLDDFGRKINSEWSTQKTQLKSTYL